MFAPSWRVIGSGVYWLSIPDVKSKLFESIWPIPKGVNYNAYLVKDGDENLLIDSSKNIISIHELIKLVEEIVPVDNLKHIAILHTEPDHSGLVGEFSNMVEKPTLYSTQRASNFMRSMFNVETKVIKDGDIIKIGGRSLRVIELPWIHWPDTMLLYLEDEGILFSSDAFGAFGALEKPVFDNEFDFNTYIDNAKEYFATVVSAYRRLVLKDFEKLEKLGLKPKVIAPAHGIVLRSRIPEVLESWVSWCRLEKRRKMTIIYGSMYGLTERLARLAENLLIGKFEEIAMHNAADDNVNRILSDTIDSAGVLFVTPTYEGNVFPPVSNIVELMRVKKMGEGKLASVVVTKLWGGTAGDQLAAKLKESGYEVLSPIQEYINYPMEQELKGYREFLLSFAQEVLGKLEVSS